MEIICKINGIDTVIISHHIQFKLSLRNAQISIFAIAILAIVFNLISLNLSHVDSHLIVTKYLIENACEGEWLTIYQ